MRWFADSAAASAPYSIHRMVRVGAKFDYTVGECFAPTQICRVLKLLVRAYSPDGITLYEGGGKSAGRRTMPRMHCVPFLSTD